MPMTRFVNSLFLALLSFVMVELLMSASGAVTYFSSDRYFGDAYGFMPVMDTVRDF